MPPKPAPAPTLTSTREPRLVQPVAIERKRALLEQAQKSSDEDSDAPKPKRLRTSPPASEQPKTQTMPSQPRVIADVVEVDADVNTRIAPGKEEDAETELKRLMKSWTAPVYAFFEPVPQIEYHDGRRCHVFQCHGRTCSKTIRRFLDKKDRNSTSNLIHHVRTCKSWGNNLWESAKNVKDVTDARENVVKPYRMSGSVTAAIQIKGKGKVTYSHRQRTSIETRAEIIRWFTENFRPFDTVEDRGFKSLMKTGRPDHYLPSAATVSRDVKRVFARCRTKFAKMLREYDGDLNFVTDTWTSPNRKAYIGITVHFEKDENPMTLVLDVIEVAKLHSGINLAAAFKASLKEFGIDRKILSITANSASNNDAMVAELESSLDDFSAVNRTRCFLNIVNLIAKSFLNQFDAKHGGAHDDAELDSLVQEVTREAAQAVGDDGEDDDKDDDLDGWIDEVERLTEEERHELVEKIKPIKRVLFKLRKLAYVATTVLLPEWVQAFEEADKEAEYMPRDTETRWNSTYDMCGFANTHRDVLDIFTAQEENNLQKYHVTRPEWDITEQLCRILKVLKEATLYFSRSVPNLAAAIPAMDQMVETLSGYSVDQTFDPAIRAAVSTALKTLKRHYSLTEMSEPHIIAMILHPGRKLYYFEKSGRKKEWIEKAEQTLRDEFERSYSDSPADDHQMEEDKREDTDMSDAMDIESPLNVPQQLDDEISCYLRALPEFPENVLLWWVEHKQIYPRLSRMALDYLTIPATSVNVKQLFSKGSLLLSHARSRLSVQSTRALLCLNSWSLAGLVSDKDILAVSAGPELEKGEDEPGLELGWDAIGIP